MGNKRNARSPRKPNMCSKSRVQRLRWKMEKMKKMTAIAASSTGQDNDDEISSNESVALHSSTSVTSNGPVDHEAYTWCTWNNVPVVNYSNRRPIILKDEDDGNYYKKCCEIVTGTEEVTMIKNDETIDQIVFTDPIEVINLKTSKKVELSSEFHNEGSTDDQKLSDCYTIENDTILENPLPAENFLCDLAYVIGQAREIEHHIYNCSFGGQFIFQKIVRKGLQATCHYICNKKMCSKTKVIQTQKRVGSINKFAVLGAITTGNGFVQEKEKFCCMNTSYMNKNTFHRCEQVIGELLKSNADDATIEAINEEKRLAELRNDKDGDGYHCIAVIVDGGWCKRTYGHGFNASSGVAVIIGMLTNKIIYIGIRNKLCMVCAGIKSGRIQAKDHLCWKNWNGPSTGMESDIIVEGLKYLDEAHQLRCTRLIGDGDSNTMAKIKEKLSYGSRVQKVECANHACRRYGKALHNIQKSTHMFTGTDGRESRKLLLTKISQLVNGARTTIKNHAISNQTIIKGDEVEKLVNELKNGPNHVFGKHDHCGKFCKKIGHNENPELYNKINNCGMLQAILSTLDRILVSCADTLLYNATSNSAEMYMSLFCKTLGGKRVDFSKAGGINRRAHAAALSFQRLPEGSQGKIIQVLSGDGLGSSYLKHIASREKIRKSRALLTLKKKKAVIDYVPMGGDKNYGINAQ